MSVLTVARPAPAGAGADPAASRPDAAGSPALLHAQLAGCLQLVLRAVRAATPPTTPPVSPATPGSPEHPAPDEIAGAPALVPLKVRSEAAMLLRAAREIAATGSAGHAAGIPTLLDALGDALESGRDSAAAVTMCLQPGAALDLALVHLHLRDAGRPNAGFDRLLADLLDSDRLEGPERQPNRVLEQLWLHGLWTGRPDHRRIRRAVAESSLARPMDALGSTPEDLYALTHTVLYATDLGRRSIVTPRPIEAIRDDAEAGLAAALDADNLDLAAELLWLWPMLGLAWSPAAVLAWSVVSGRYGDLGFLPGPGFRAARASRPTVGGDGDLVLRTSYHATLVHGILIGALLATGRLPEWPAAEASAPGAGTANGAGDADTAGAANAALALLDPPAAATWRAYLAGAPGLRDTVAPLVFAAALRRARDRHDLAGVRDALATGLKWNLLDAPAPRQATALLRRAALVLG